MKHVFRISLAIVLVLSITTLFFTCSKETGKEGGTEALKSAAKEFQPIMTNLGNALKQGDLAAAKETLASLKEKLPAIQQAEVPERLIESKDKIITQKEKLSTSIDEFTTSLTQPDLTEIDSTILKSYDTMRVNFARLGALLRVKIPELVSFHEALYTLWHDYYPNDAIDSIKTIIPEFKEKAAALDNIEWLPVLQQDLESIKMKVKELQQSVVDLEAVCQGDDAEAIKKAAEVLHEKYVGVNRML